MPGYLALVGHADAPLLPSGADLGWPLGPPGMCPVGSALPPALGPTLLCAAVLGAGETGRPMSAMFMDQAPWVCGPRTAQAG